MNEQMHGSCGLRFFVFVFWAFCIVLIFRWVFVGLLVLVAGLMMDSAANKIRS